METDSVSRIRNFLLATIFLAGLIHGTPASAIGHAYLIDLKSRTATDLGLEAYGFATIPDINDAGQVVGVSYTRDGSKQAFITGPDGMGMRDLGTLGGGWSQAYGINDAGQVVGWSPPAGGRSRAFITGPDGEGMRDLGTLGGPSSVGYGINDAGQVVGMSYLADDDWEVGMPYMPDGDWRKRRAFITGPDGVGMRDLGTLGEWSRASGINNAGQMVGDSLMTDGELQAFITGPDGVGMRGLGTLGGRGSQAYGINDAGQVVGMSFTADGFRAFITGPDGTGMVDLNSLVELPPGMTLASANGINDTGQVIAIAVIPEPESYALLLAGLVLIGAVVGRKNGEVALLSA